MPFGLVNAPSVFQRLINKIIGNLHHEQVLVYMDDLLIPSITIEEGLESLEKVFFLLNEIKPIEMFIFKTKINYLGSIKTVAIASFKRSSNIHKIRLFLGLVWYFRRFNQNVATIALPLTELRKM